MAVARKPKQSGDDGKGMNRRTQDNSLGPFPQPSRFSGRPVNATRAGSSYPSRTATSSGGGGSLYAKLTGLIGGGLKRGSK